MKNVKIDNIVKIVIRYFLYFVIYVLIAFFPGILYALVRYPFYRLVIGLINAGNIDSSMIEIIVGNLIGMFLYHVVLLNIVLKLKFIKKFCKSIIEKTKIDFSNISFKDYINKTILIGFIWCYISYYMNNIDINVQIIAIYIALYSLFNSKPQRNY